MDIPGSLNICADCEPSARCPVDFMPLPSRSTSADLPGVLDTALLLCSFLLPAAKETFPVKASVVIPVRNRERTILDAVQSALVQSAKQTSQLHKAPRASSAKAGALIFAAEAA